MSQPTHKQSDDEAEVSACPSVHADSIHTDTDKMLKSQINQTTEALPRLLNLADHGSKDETELQDSESHDTTVRSPWSPQQSHSLEADKTVEHFSKPLQLFAEKKVVKICAPMVRYSKLPFRMLVRKYGCDLAFTPMIIANSFNRSLQARDSEFTTNSFDRPLIVQFAANNSKDFADAAEIVSPYSDGVDLNCGCPQRWAMGEGYGACLINKTELLADMVKQAKNRVNNSDFTVSTKIRVHTDLRKTVELCQRLEHCGVSFITVHGRTMHERTQPVSLSSIKLIRENVSVPVVANGDIKTMEDVEMVARETGVHGVMAARGILQNPAMYAGYKETPLECVKDWLDIAISVGLPYKWFHHHLISMMERIAPRAERRIFNCLSSTSAVLEYLKEKYGI